MGKIPRYLRQTERITEELCDTVILTLNWLDLERNADIIRETGLIEQND
jgi:hypothetical protein